MPGPLTGIRVLEAAQVISGPLCGLLLAEQGADVIKIEQPGGDPTRVSGEQRGGMGVVFFNCNRGKRSIVVDLTDPEGVAVVHELVRAADVFIENFRPGKAERLGIDHRTLAAINPHLVTVSITGVGPDGPDAERPMYDFVVQAMIGVADLQRDLDTGRPRLVRTYLVDKSTALTAAQAITAALFARERDPNRRGQHLDVSMLDAGLGFFWPDGMMSHTYLDRDEVDAVPNNLEFQEAYPTLDGAVALLPIIPTFFPNLCRACRHPEWIDDPRFVDYPTRRRHFRELVDAVAAATATMTTAEAMARFEAEDVPAAAVRTRDEVHDQPQVVHRGSVVETAMEPVGNVRVPNHPTRFSATPARLGVGVPRVGEHARAVLAEAGFEAGRVDDLLTRRIVRESAD